MSNYVKENLIPLPTTSVPAGTLAIKVGDEIFTAGTVKVGTDTSDADATASDILEGKTAYVKGQKITGTLTATGGGESDFYKCTEVLGPKTVNFVAASDAGTAACVGKYMDTGTKKNGESVYKYESPSGTDWYIYFISVDWEGDYWVLANSLNVDYPSGGHYYGSSLSGNWSTGEYGEGGVTITKGAETINSDQPKTWSGRKAVFDGTKYVLEEAITADIPYDRIVPVVGKYYPHGCLISSDYIYTGYPEISCPVEPDSDDFGDWLISASSVFDSPRPPYKAFTEATSSSLTDGWHSSGEQGAWIQWQNKKEQVLITHWSILFRGDTLVDEFSLQGSDDGVTWHSIDIVNNAELASSIERTIDNITGYFYHRVVFGKSSSTGNYIMVYRITAKS